MIAADSQGTRESGLIVSYSEKKVKRINGDLVACYGRNDDCEEYERWYEGGCDPESKPDIGEDFGALLLTSEGRIFLVYEKLVPVEVHEPFMAIGVGDSLATGAMAHGASPREAIEIACRYDSFTGPPVVVKHLDERDE